LIDLLLSLAHSTEASQLIGEMEVVTCGVETCSSVVSQNGMGTNNRHLYEAEALVISVYQAWAGKDARVQRDSVGN